MHATSISFIVLSSIYTFVRTGQRLFISIKGVRLCVGPPTTGKSDSLKLSLVVIPHTSRKGRKVKAISYAWIRSVPKRGIIILQFSTGNTGSSKKLNEGVPFSRLRYMPSGRTQFTGLNHLEVVEWSVSPLVENCIVAVVTISGCLPNCLPLWISGDHRNRHAVIQAGSS